MRKKIKSRQSPRPDESFSSGPFQMVRFGRHIVAKTNFAPGQLEAIQDQFAAGYSEVVAEIDELVESAARLVAKLPPLELMHRAWWTRAGAMLQVKSESDVGQSEVLAERMVDYVQSLIASCPRDAEQKTSVSDEDWANLRSFVDEIFSKLNSRYFLAATAKRRKADPEITPAMEYFLFQSQLYWANVKASQYQVHQVSALRDLLRPESLIVKKLYGMTSDELCDELAKLQHAQTFGVSDASSAMHQFREKSLAHLQSDIENGLAHGSDFAEMLRESVERHGLSGEGERAFGMLLGSDLLDVEKNSNLPSSFKKDFSWGPGEDGDFFSEGDFRGWPLRVWPTFKRPFLILDGKYYCYDSSTLFDRIYRQIEKRAFALGGSEKQQWIDGRKLVTEELPFAYLQAILPGARVLKGVYYDASESGKAAKWCELDGLITFDDHLFIVEVKSGAFTYTSPATDSEAHINSLRALVEDPAKQGTRFLNYLRSAKEVALFDVQKKEVDRISLTDYRQATLLAFTLDPFTEIAAQSQKLSDIGLSLGEESVWSVSIDDIRVYADIFESPFEFLHFVEQRTKSLRSKLIELDDELDHLGLYLKHNQYERYANELAGGERLAMRFTGYRADIDVFFAERMKDPSVRSPLRQELPSAMGAVLELLKDTGRDGSARLASHLLDLAGDWRIHLFDGIEKRLRDAAGTPIGALSTTGEVRITLQPLLSHIDSDSEGAAIDNVKAMLLLHGETDRLLLILQYDSPTVLRDVKWSWIKKDDITEPEIPHLQALAEMLRSRRHGKAAAAGKIGRNAGCPCASGKKYKRCCLGRNM
ncbi:SEC-C metal-binding domain-containing protein [Stenotrophomonas sp. AB1(2024)]|uniref:SEC-C metal-binding domain-containing protein n=1 Tax=Stenotrophomonas sp. AB1(2024) TaxID=3132215 RepID=UPI0030B04CF7